MKTLLLWLCTCLCLVSCKKEDVTEGVSIRIRNASTYSLENITVKTPGGQNSYGTVASGQASDYQVFSKAYSYAYVNVTVQGQELLIQPIDYVGERPLAAGRYTYVLDIVADTPNRLTLRLDR